MPVKTGDKVIVVNPYHTETEYGYEKGDIFTVWIVFSESIRTTTDLGLWNFEYEIYKE